MGCRRTPARPSGRTWSTQFFALSGAHSTPPHLPAIGLEEQGYHLVRQGLPILTSADSVEVPGGVPASARRAHPAVRVVDGVAAQTLGTADRRRSGAPRPSWRPPTGGWRRDQDRRDVAPGAGRDAPGRWRATSSSRAAARSNAFRDRLHHAHRLVLIAGVPQRLVGRRLSCASAAASAGRTGARAARSGLPGDEARGLGDR